MTAAESFQIDAVMRHAESAAAAYALRPPAALTRGPAGVYLGSGSGTSIDFHDFRQYQPGDDLRRVDWGAYARNDALVIRLFREEISPVVEVVLDTSASMAVCEGKLAATVFLAAFLAGVTRKSEGRPILVTPEGRFPGGLFESGLRATRFTGSGNLGDRPPSPSRGGNPVRFLLSDFLYPADMHAFLGRCARGAAAVVPLQLLARQELHPEARGGVRFVNIEREDERRDLRVDGGMIARYRRRLEAHLAALDEAARQHRTAALRFHIPDAFESARATCDAVTAELARQGIVEAA